MAHYIDKDALVAEIEKRRSRNSKNKLNLAAAFEDNYLLSFLNTIEVKEVDLEKEYDICKALARFVGGSFGKRDFDIAMHFYGLGKAQKGE